MRVPLHAVAHGRAGDKGDASNVSVIAYLPAAWPAIRDQIDEAAVMAIFAPLGATEARRYELPRLHALNFVVEGALGGGVNSTLALDRHGKTLSFLLLGEATLEVEPEMIPEASSYRNVK
ncbi:MAG: hypothetical protein AAGF90_04495 [Pseudomonadota bacterium]